MRLEVKEQIKALLAQENIKLKELVEELITKTGQPYSSSSLSHRLSRGKVTYNEVLTIADILGYDIKFERRES